METITAYQQFVRENDAVTCLQEAMQLFCVAAPRTVTGIILDQNVLDHSKRSRSGDIDILDHILFSSKMSHHIDPELLTTFQNTKELPSLPSINVISDFLAARIESHITGSTIAILWAAKTYKNTDDAKDNHFDQKQSYSSESDNSDSDSKSISISNRDESSTRSTHSVRKEEAFSDNEAACFFQMIEIARTKVIIEACRLEKKDQKERIKKIEAEKQDVDRNLMELTQTHEQTTCTLFTAHTKIKQMKIELERLQICETDAAQWNRQSMVDHSLSSLIIDKDDLTTVTNKLCLSLGIILEVAPSACSVSLRQINSNFNNGENGKNGENVVSKEATLETGVEKNEVATFLPLLSPPNVLCDSLQVNLTHQGIQLGQVATPRISKERGMHELLNVWVSRVCTWLYMWRCTMINKMKQQRMRTTENRVHTMINKMEKVKDERDKLVQEKEEFKFKVENQTKVIEEEKEHRLRVEGQCEMLQAKINKTSVEPAHHEYSPPFAPSSLSSAFSYGPSSEDYGRTENITNRRMAVRTTGDLEIQLQATEEYKRGLQRECSKLKMQVETQERQIAQQQELNLQQMKIHSASEKNSLQRITELQTTLKNVRKNYETLKIKYEKQAARFHNVLVSSKELLSASKE